MSVVAGYGNEARAVHLLHALDQQDILPVRMPENYNVSGRWLFPKPAFFHNQQNIAWLKGGPHAPAFYSYPQPEPEQAAEKEGEKFNQLCTRQLPGFWSSRKCCGSPRRLSGDQGHFLHSALLYT